MIRIGVRIDSEQVSELTRIRNKGQKIRDRQIEDVQGEWIATEAEGDDFLAFLLQIACPLEFLEFWDEYVREPQ